MKTKVAERTKEKRKYLRFDCSVKATYELVDEYANPKEAFTKDVSRGGLRLVLNQEIPAQSKIKIHFHIPKEKEPIDAIAEVVWIRKDLQKGVLHTGLKFVKISPSNKARLLEHAYEFWKETSTTKA